MTTESAALVAQSLVVIAGSLLVVGVLLGLVVAAWRQDRRDDQADQLSVRQFEAASTSMERIRHRGPYAHRRSQVERLHR